MAAVATDHIRSVEPLGAGCRGNLDIDAVSLRRDAGDAVAEAHVEIGGIGVFSGDRGSELVLLVLQYEWKLEFVAHSLEVEFGDDRLGHPVVKAVLGGYEAKWNDR